MKNKDIDNTGKVSGMLLYVKTEDEIPTPENSYNMNGNNITIKILDLNQEFFLIKNKLNQLADNFIQN